LSLPAAMFVCSASTSLLISVWITTSLASRICLGCYYRLRQLRRLRRWLDSDSLAALVYAVVNSRNDYCNTVLAGAPRTVTDKLQRMLNAAARVVTGTWKFDRHLGFSKFRIFNGRVRHECRTASPCQISSKSFELRPRYVSINIMLVWLQNAYSRPFWVFFVTHFPK